MMWCTLNSAAHDKAKRADCWCCLPAQIDPRSSLSYYAKAVLILSTVAASYFGTFFAFQSFAVRTEVLCTACEGTLCIHMYMFACTKKRLHVML